MSNKPVQLRQGTLDIIVLPALWSMGPLHAYALMARLEEVADEPFTLNYEACYSDSDLIEPAARKEA